jgi:hypothetical protein
LATLNISAELLSDQHFRIPYFLEDESSGKNILWRWYTTHPRFKRERFMTCAIRLIHCIGLHR